jgi:hypothetical protein
MVGIKDSPSRTKWRCNVSDKKFTSLYILKLLEHSEFKRPPTEVA